jgi:hypothetical protein
MLADWLTCLLSVCLLLCVRSRFSLMLVRGHQERAAAPRSGACYTCMRKMQHTCSFLFPESKRYTACCELCKSVISEIPPGVSARRRSDAAALAAVPMAEQQQGGAWPHGARETEEHPWATPGQQQPAFPVGAPPPTLQHYQHELEQQLQHQLVWQLQCSAMLQAVPPPELGWPAGGAASAQFQPPSPLDQLSHLSYQIDPQMQPAPQPQQVQMNQQYLHDMQQQRPAALPQSVSAAMPPFNPSLTPQFTPSWPPRAPGGHGAAVGGSRLSPRAQVPPPHPLSRRLSEEGRSQAGSSRDDSQHGRGEESRRGEESSRSEGAGATSDEIRIAAFLSQACQTGGGRCGEGGGRSSPATAGGARPSTPGGTRATPDSGGGQPYERPPCAPAPSSSDPSSVSDPRASSAPGVSVSPGVAAGVIFGCNNETYDECFELSMVGLPRKYMPLAHSVRAG